MRPAPEAEVKQDTHPESPYNGSWSVDAGYYGLVDIGRIGWAVELLPSREVAERIVEVQDYVSRAVEKHGGRARVYVEVDDENDLVTITEYDWKDWQEVVEL